MMDSSPCMGRSMQRRNYSLNYTWGQHYASAGEAIWRTAFSPWKLVPPAAVILLVCPHIFFCYPEKDTGGKHIHTFRNSDKGMFLRRILNITQESAYFFRGTWTPMSNADAGWTWSSVKHVKQYLKFSGSQQDSGKRSRLSVHLD